MEILGAISTYPTPESLQQKVDEYFDYCFIMEEKYGRMIPKCIVPPTFSGLARYLGFGSRKALIDYVGGKGNELYDDILNDAKLRIEDFCEQKLIMSKGPSTGIQFALKNNCGWDDTSKTQLTGPDNRPVVFSWGVDEKQLEPVTVDSVATEVQPTEVKTIEALPAPITEREKEEATNSRFDADTEEPAGETEEPQDLGFTIEF